MVSVLAISAVLCVASISIYEPIVALYCVVAAFLLSVTQVGASVSGLDPRYAAFPFALILLLVASSRQCNTWSRTRIVVRYIFLLGIIGVLTALKADLVHLSHLLGSIVALIVVAMTVWSASRLFLPEIITRTLLYTVGVPVLLSVPLALTGYGIIGVRGAGLFGNPNGLGLAAAMCIPLALGTCHRRGMRILLCGGFVTAVLISGSRAALGMVALELLIWYFPAPLRKYRLRLGVVAFLAVTVEGILVGTSTHIGSNSITGPLQHLVSGGASRLTNWRLGIRLIQEHLIWGLGPNVDTLDIASSYLTVIAEAGVIGVIVAVRGLIIVIAIARRAPPMVQALVVAAAFDAIFEQWLFVGGSAYFLMFWLVLGTARDTCRGGTAVSPIRHARPASSAETPKESGFEPG